MKTPPALYLNRYRCVNHAIPVEWDDEWDCMCNDRCPECNAEIEPFESEDLIPELPDESPSGV